MSQQFDAGVPSPARIWNYWVGGKDNFEADRKAADAVREVVPYVPVVARMTRQFLNRAVTLLASDYGVRQFLDIGSGLPTAYNTHQVAQAVAPQARIVYVDNDRRKSGCVHKIATRVAPLHSCCHPVPPIMYSTSHSHPQGAP